MLHYVTAQACLFNGQDLFRIMASWRKMALSNPDATAAAKFQLNCLTLHSAALPGVEG